MTVDESRKASRFLKEARNKAKRDYCALCKAKISSFENSHSIPRSILHNIAEQGWLYSFEQVAGTEKDPIGVGKSGTFYLLCRKCENEYFRHYENMQQLTERPTDLLMAEIALKDSLLQLYNSLVEKEVYRLLLEQNPKDKYYSNRVSVVELDIANFDENTSFYKRIIDNNEQGGFQLLYWKLLPYKIPVAIQSQIPLATDPYGNTINNNYNYSKRTESLHLVAFPLPNQSVIMAFYHKRDRKYKKVKNLFKRLTNDEILAYLNYIALKSTSNIFFSERIKPYLKSDAIRQLVREYNEIPDFGGTIHSWEDLLSARNLYHSPDIGEIPCFLLSKYSLE